MPSKETPRDQPSNVATEDAPRPPDNAVVTSDTPKAVEESRAADLKSPNAAAGGKDVTHSDTDAPPDPNKPPPAGDDPGKSSAKRNKSAERRIKKLSGRLSRVTDLTVQQQRELDSKDEEIAALKAATPDVPEPKLEDFKTPQEFGKAYSKWETDKTAAAKPPADPTARRQPPAKQPPKEDPAIAEFHKAGRKMLGDEFDEALEEEGTAVSQVMAEFLFDSEVGPAVYVHLANNQEDARKIYDSTAPKAMKALQELEAKASKGELDVEGALQLAAPPELGEHDTGPTKDGDPPPVDKAKAKPPGGTKAPIPPSDTRVAGDAPLEAKPEDEDMDTYSARRRKEIARAAGHPV